jgi:hypothetical protein
MRTKHAQKVRLSEKRDTYILQLALQFMQHRLECGHILHDMPVVVSVHLDEVLFIDGRYGSWSRWL